ncbi:MAG: glycine oxidase ThiO [Acidimicrobiales bacterium]
MDHSPDVLVIGGGVIGLSIALAARAAGAAVVVCDPQPGHGSSWAAAGMIAPVTEAHFGEEALLSLNLRSARSWPSFAHELSRVTGLDLGYQAEGTLAVAHDTGDREVLLELLRFHQELGLDSTWLTASECRQAEPLLAPSIRGGLLARCDHQVDPRRLVQALAEACRLNDVDLLADEVVELIVGRGRAGGVRLRGGGTVLARRTVLAAGWRSASLIGLPDRVRPPVRPVKGQILRLRLPDRYPPPGHTVRAISRGSSVYIVVRPDGEIVCGATVEEMGDDTTVTGGGVYSLLRDAQLVFPVLLEASFVEASAGLRPGSPDNAPLIGPSELSGLLVATGHYRNGVLLAPVTADLMAGLLASDLSVPELPGWAKSFDPRRFGGKP